MNPFIKEIRKASWFAKYMPDEITRIVWLKGSRAKVQSGEFRCSILEFDSVVYFGIQEVHFSPDISNASFSSKDDHEIKANVQLVIIAKQTDEAIITLTTRFDDIYKLLKADIENVLREWCKSYEAHVVSSTEAALGSRIVESLTKHHTYPFEVRRATMRLASPLLEATTKAAVAENISQKQTETKELNALAIAKIRNSKTLEELKFALEEEQKRLESECERSKKQASTQLANESARLEYLKQISDLTDNSKTAILHIAPQIYEKLEIAKLSTLETHREKAYSEIIGLLRELSPIRSNSSPVTNVFGTQNSTKE